MKNVLQGIHRPILCLVGLHIVLRAALFQDRHAQFFVKILRWLLMGGRGGLVDGRHEEEEGSIAWIDGLCFSVAFRGRSHWLCRGSMACAAGPVLGLP
ncbi:hypothetical protein [Acidovorax sp. JHL-9]|uniref:hypothetical protein n=1 Tax=Acidovorax sp. JHL-9 TaxID=1276756 RepID=UPI0012DF3847|nr:hypothetical protein [Acidovorax sp. JHL-9]